MTAPRVGTSSGPPRVRMASLTGAVLLTCVALLVGLTRTARAQPDDEPARAPAVLLELSSLFGAESTGMVGTAPLRVTLTNTTNRNLHGELLVAPVGWRERDLPQRYSVDLAARESRVVPVVIYLSTSAERVVLTYQAEGLREQRAEVPLMLRNTTGVAVLADPPRLRGHLFPLTSGAGGSAYAGDVSIAEVLFAPASGDPLVPAEPAGWSTYPVVFATVAEAERLEGAARRALVGHVQAGARVVLVPRRPEDCASPIVRELMAELRCAELNAEGTPPEGDLPAWTQASRMTVEGDAHTLREPFGLSRPLGFGTVFMLAWDANAADADPLASEYVLQAVLDHLKRPVQPHHTLGGRPSDVGALRTALDPNESFRPTLGAVALLLLLYVFAVGPINFHVIAQRGQPTLALLTTPLISLACLLLMASAAYLSKGVWMRYRSIEVTELVSGESRGVVTRYLGYYLTRPSTFDITPREGVRTTLLESGGGGRSAVGVPLAEGLALRSVQGGLWETIVTQEQAVADTQDAIRVEIRRDDATRVTVVNHGTQPLRGAIYVNQVGEVYTLGDLAPGESRAQPAALLTTLPEWELRMPRGNAPELELVAEQLGLHAEAGLAVRGAMSVMRNGASREGVWAHVDGEGAGPSTEGFEHDWAYRFVFIAANSEAASPALVPAPDPTLEEAP